MSFGKKYKKTSRNILQKEKYLQKELLKTDMLHELKNVTTGVYSVVNTHDEIPYTPSVYSDVPVDIDFNKILKLKETVTRYFKKPVKIKSWYKKG